MKTCCVKSSWLSLLVGFAVVGAAAIGFLAGRSTPGMTVGGHVLPGLMTIDASASAIGDEFSMATGQVSTEAEGIFVLDHASGLLQCNVLYPRTGQFGAAFQTNVKEALAGAGGKNSKYLMVTGAAQFPRGTANCAVYVLDQSSGAYACYGIPFNESAVNARAPQMGVMPLLAIGQARVALDRDALR